MSDWDIAALQTSFEGWRNERADDLPADRAFERFTIDQILKDADLSDDEISSGALGGPDDGGIDGIYLFVNRVLVQEDSEIPDPAITVDLFIIQAKNESGFREETIIKLDAFARDIFNYTKPVEDLTYYNSLVRDAISLFRDTYNNILGDPHHLTIQFAYASKADGNPHSKVQTRTNNLLAYVKGVFSGATVDFAFWNASRLLMTVRSIPKTESPINIVKHFSTSDTSCVCLVNLRDFANFITDDSSELRRNMLEPNVRDYQGTQNPVNKDIRESLQDPAGAEFWWLNNGITILAKKCTFAGDIATIERAEIVNGLQTSYEIFTYFKKNPSAAEERNILIRIIVLTDDQARSRIIKATNTQTPVSPVSLRATEKIHFDIEGKLQLYHLFYDRRKGEYRELKKPISKIISIRNLAQTVIAILLQRPDDARARPTTLLRDDATYHTIFSDSYNRDGYVACVLIDRIVNNYFSSSTDLPSDVRRDVRYYLDMWISCELTEKARPDWDDITMLLPKVGQAIAPEKLTEGLDIIHQIYEQLGANDRVAKGPEMKVRLASAIAEKYSND